MKEDETEAARDVVRARRIELVDGDGRVRGVVGEISPPGPRSGAVFGAEFYLADGEPRASVAMEGGRAWFTLEMAGNIRVHAGVNDATTEAVDETAYLYLLGPDGAPLIGWRVADDGTLVEHRS